MLVDEVFKGKEIFVEVRRWNKDYLFKNIDVAREIVKEVPSKAIATPYLKAKNIVLIDIERDVVVFAYVDENIASMFEKPSIPIEAVSKVIAIVDRM
jgi:hypothetical protein